MKNEVALSAVEEALALFEVSPKSCMSLDWLKLTENRFALIKPHLDTFTLMRLGDIPLDSPGSDPQGRSRLRDFLELRTGPFTFGSDFKGVFGIENVSHVKGAPLGKGIRKFWGLSRQGNWISGEISYTKNGHDWSISWDDVNLSKTSLDELVPVWKAAIWKGLGEIIEDWYRRTQSRFEVVSTLHDVIQAQDLMVQA